MKVQSSLIAYNIVCGNNDGSAKWQDPSTANLPSHCARLLSPEDERETNAEESATKPEPGMKTSSKIDMKVSLHQNPLSNEMFRMLKEIANNCDIDAIDRRRTIKEALVDWQVDKPMRGEESSPHPETSSVKRSYPEEFLAALEREGWPGKATYCIREIAEVMAW